MITNTRIIILFVVMSIFMFKASAWSATGFPDGDLLGDGVTIADALRALKITVGLVTPVASDFTHCDIAPLKNGYPTRNGKIDIADALLILKKIVGLETWVPTGSGMLDTSFGTEGKVLASVGDRQATARAIGIQQDGKIVVAGGSYSIDNQNYINEEMIVMRINPDGSPDNSFGAGGMVTLSINSGAQATALAIQPDGKIVVGGFVSYGSNNYDFLAVRLDSDGTLDQGFGSDGKVITSIIPQRAVDSLPLGFWGSKANGLVLQLDGKIVIAGDIYEGWKGSPGPDGSLPTGFALSRYNADGSIDNSFGMNGIVLTTPDRFSTVESIAIQPDGKLVVGGGSSGGGNYLPFIYRYNSVGAPDVSFGSNGVVSGSLTGVISSVAMQPDELIVATKNDGTLLRYHADGSKDTDFGNDGAVFDQPWWASKAAILVQNDGKIVVAGSAVDPIFLQDGTWYGDPPTDFMLGRFNINGKPDVSIGSSGSILGLTGKNAQASAIALQLDGKLVIAGTSIDDQSNNAITIVRCLP